MSEETEADPNGDLEKAITTLSAVLLDPKDPNAPGPLKSSWNFLQVYSTWGLRLPITDEGLKIELSITDPGRYSSFFETLRGAFELINTAGSIFQTGVLPGVIKVGRSILDYASDVDPEDSDIFGLIADIVKEGDPETALEIIGDLKETAEENRAEAEKIEGDLNDFSVLLSKAQGQLNIANAAIDIDSKTSRESIDTLSGGAEAEGSLINLAALLKSKKEDYDQAVVVATTTVTYAWITPPVGLIVAASVAGVYGDKAVKALEEVERQTADLAAKHVDLNTAIKTRAAQGNAKDSVSDAIRFTDLAVDQTTRIKNAWSGIGGHLDTVIKKVGQMTIDADGSPAVADARYVKILARKAGKAWAELITPLKALTRNPFIVVENTKKSAGDLAEDIKKELAKQAA